MVKHVGRQPINFIKERVIDDKIKSFPLLSDRDDHNWFAAVRVSLLVPIDKRPAEPVGIMLLLEVCMRNVNS